MTATGRFDTVLRTARRVMMMMERMMMERMMMMARVMMERVMMMVRVKRVERVTPL